MEIRTGLGIDFHRLIENEKRPLLIANIEIKGKLALEGHSDADVLLHALSDAILGALGEDDIGEFFSNLDPKNKDMNSKNILDLALTKMKKQKFKITNVDITLIGEQPRISPYKVSIKKSLHKLIGINLDCISIKATTTEKMGALGREEGLACFANVLLLKESN